MTTGSSNKKGDSEYRPPKHDLTSFETCPNRTFGSLVNRHHTLVTTTFQDHRTRNGQQEHVKLLPDSARPQLQNSGTKSICERLRRWLTPSACHRPHCSSHPTAIDASWKVSLGLTTNDLEKARPPYKVSLSPNTNGTETGRNPEQVSPDPVKPSSSGKVP